MLDRKGNIKKHEILSTKPETNPNIPKSKIKKQKMRDLGNWGTKWRLEYLVFSHC